MPAERVHLVRHGEVFNPEQVLYGRLPHFHLSAAGRQMAQTAAEYVLSLDRPVSSVRCSPLERARESAAPFARAFGTQAIIEPRIIEPWNVFEGTRMRRALLKPHNWRHLRRPQRPSWGEPYASIAARMHEAMDAAWHEIDGGDVVFVSHQAPIWITHLSVAGLALRHDPRTRRCALSSVTSFERAGDAWREVGYAAPAVAGIDLGAV